MHRRSEPDPSKPGLAPVRLKQTPSQRRAVRIANGADVYRELANAVAFTVAVCLPALTLFAIQVRGCVG